MEKIILRDLPGIADLETQFLIRDKLMADELDHLRATVDTVCINLFGIRVADTISPPSSVADWDEWQTYFRFLYEDYEEQEDAFWEAFGIDTDGYDGYQLECLEVIGRRLICALRQLHPAASQRFAPGRKSDEQLQAEAEAWGRWLKASKGS